MRRKWHVLLRIATRKCVHAILKKECIAIGSKLMRHINRILQREFDGNMHKTVLEL